MANCLEWGNWWIGLVPIPKHPYTATTTGNINSRAGIMIWLPCVLFCCHSKLLFLSPYTNSLLHFATFLSQDFFSPSWTPCSCKYPIFSNHLCCTAILKSSCWIQCIPLPYFLLPSPFASVQVSLVSHFICFLVVFLPFLLRNIAHM